MPMYDYQCEKCKHIWESFESYANREKPTTVPCTECNATDIIRTIGGFPGIASDTTLTADKKTGGQWSEMMDRVKNSGTVPKRYHDRLDQSTNQSGRKWS